MLFENKKKINNQKILLDSRQPFMNRVCKIHFAHAEEAIQRKRKCQPLNPKPDPFTPSAERRLPGIFKIDTATGKVWRYASSVANKKTVEKWIPISE